MKFRDAILVAYRGLTRHWVRATLNVLGIVAGVASVIMLVSVAHAVGGTAKAAVAGLGANLVVVYPAGASIVRSPARHRYTLELDVVRRDRSEQHCERP